MRPTGPLAHLLTSHLRACTRAPAYTRARTPTRARAHAHPHTRGRSPWFAVRGPRRAHVPQSPHGLLRCAQETGAVRGSQSPVPRRQPPCELHSPDEPHLHLPHGLAAPSHEKPSLNAPPHRTVPGLLTSRLVAQLIDCPPNAPEAHPAKQGGRLGCLMRADLQTGHAPPSRPTMLRPLTPHVLQLEVRGPNDPRPPTSIHEPRERTLHVSFIDVEGHSRRRNFRPSSPPPQMGYFPRRKTAWKLPPKKALGDGGDGFLEKLFIYILYITFF